MNYAEIKNCDIADGAGVRVTLFVSGCTNRCEGCFQPETWDFEYGKPFTEETELSIIEMLRPDYIDGLTLLGGDPMEPKNQRALLPFLQRVKYEYPNKTIWAFTGFLIEDLQKEGTYCRCEVTDEILNKIDVLVDGPFIQEQKNISLQFRGSENQRIIDLNGTRENGKIVLWEE